ncbi:MULTISPECIES: MFS transporter [Pantoea]|jgi:predicted MFS family arabinose efflux permease|uniref:MFS transporter n=1 Tax=Pantoea piersonii TaxID=2364647 RepID=A0AAJ5QNS6_9GAMM|nr:MULTISPECIES: MFS transporter [Pantoea]MDU6431375.1 MFS transporter [Pantoea sp.]MBZ6384350.1 MFS transporter [Pantoea piersonii]MBZ6399909.1 MFS transporter [Pantoea piersonii]MBZ6406389.1 MFS transporter [Pantoea piersonii]MBZ6425135.1 MFS transporter [Pantoea piersonii]
MKASGKSSWPLAFCAGLLGIGQNGLLVVLPQLVDMTGLTLSTWAGLLMFGSMLFLPASPWWGRVSEVKGCKFVVVVSLAGYLLSFGVMALMVWLMAEREAGIYAGLAGLILSRVIYGLTVSGMVPAAQTWAMQRAGTDKRMAALAVISSGLSCGRLLGPPLAALALGVYPMAPLWLMAVAPLFALILISGQYRDPPLAAVPHHSARLHSGLLPCLLLAALLALCISLMQIGLTPILRGIIDAPAAVSRHIAWLLSLAAASTLLAQFLIVRPQRLGLQPLLFTAALLMSTGLGMMVIGNLMSLYAGIAVTSFGAAMATPAYQLLLNQKLSLGKGAGLIATSHTLGYGLSALLIPFITWLSGQNHLLAGAWIASMLFFMMTCWLGLTARAESTR